MVTVIPILVTFSIFAGIIGAFCTCWFAGVMNAVDLEYGLQYMFVEWFIWAGIIKSLFFAFIIASVSAFFGYGRWWIDCCGKGFYGCRSIQQCIDSVCGLDIN